MSRRGKPSTLADTSAETPGRLTGGAPRVARLLATRAPRSRCDGGDFRRDRARHRGVLPMRPLHYRPMRCGYGRRTEGGVTLCMRLLSPRVVAGCLGYISSPRTPLTAVTVAAPIVTFADASPRQTIGRRAHVCRLRDATPAGAFATRYCAVLHFARRRNEHGTCATGALAATTARGREAGRRGTRHLHIAPEALTCVEFPLQARIPGGTISVAETFDLAPDDVLVLDSALQGVVELCLGGRNCPDGQTVAVGRLGSQNGKWAVRMDELRTETIIGRDAAGRHTGDGQ